MLGVSAGRVTQMMDARRLEWLEDAGRKWVTVYSVEARLAEQPKAGRPRRESAMAAGVIASKNEARIARVSCSGVMPNWRFASHQVLR